MNELQQSLLDLMNRIEREQSQRLAAQDAKIAALEQEIQGYRNLQSELERVLSELEKLFAR